MMRTAAVSCRILEEIRGTAGSVVKANGMTILAISSHNYISQRRILSISAYFISFDEWHSYCFTDCGCELGFSLLKLNKDCLYDYSSLDSFLFVK